MSNRTLAAVGGSPAGRAGLWIALGAAPLAGTPITVDGHRFGGRATASDHRTHGTADGFATLCGRLVVDDWPDVPFRPGQEMYPCARCVAKAEGVVQ